MTGSVGEDEDIVQDTFLGLTRARQAGTTIADPKAYLTTVVSRLGINYLSSARVRRETYVGDWLPDPIVVPADGPGPGRARRSRGCAGLFRRGRFLGTSLRLAWVNGQPGAVGYDARGRVFTVFELEVVGGMVQAIRAVVNPDKLGHIGPVSDVARLPEKE